jgi:hypothetical protein
MDDAQDTVPSVLRPGEPEPLALEEIAAKAERAKNGARDYRAYLAAMDKKPASLIRGALKPSLRDHAGRRRPRYS